MRGYTITAIRVLEGHSQLAVLAPAIPHWRGYHLECRLGNWHGLISRIMDNSDRFFLATVMGGRLHPNGIPEWGPWEASRLHWWQEDHLDLVFRTTRERKVRTIEELHAVMKEPRGAAVNLGGSRPCVSGNAA